MAGLLDLGRGLRSLAGRAGLDQLPVEAWLFEGDLAATESVSFENAVFSRSAEQATLVLIAAIRSGSGWFAPGAGSPKRAGLIGNNRCAVCRKKMQ
ncbi:hypothetical protein [Amycolatopsis circi]|uniref:hypothetical protein n=1 Tax=Amycolatopsis circi TaxID=871959 RepID=UPI0013BE9738|nr:hypothetical protein [Amycolatopsis circi]